MDNETGTESYPCLLWNAIAHNFMFMILLLICRCPIMAEKFKTAQVQQYLQWADIWGNDGSDRGVLGPKGTVMQ